MSGPLRGPSDLHLSSQATQTYGLCALGLPLVKAAGLVQAYGLLRLVHSHHQLPLLDKRGPGGVDAPEYSRRHSGINAPAHSPTAGTSCHLPPGGGGAPL